MSARHLIEDLFAAVCLLCALAALALWAVAL